MTTNITEQLQIAIEHIVRINYAIKNVDLVLKVMAHVHPLPFETETYHMVLNTMVSNGDIIELDYTVPNMDYRIKSLYFIKGTKFSLISINTLKENV